MRLVTSSVEHPSVLETFKQLEKAGFTVTYLPVDARGIVSLRDLQDVLSPDEAVFVSVMHVNNETGSIQPIYEIASLVRRVAMQSLFHVDAVQSFGKLPEPIIPDDPDLSPDLITLSGHKIHGPKGVGALYVAPNAPIGPIVYGGGQEYGMRSGTENIPAITGFGIAAKASASDLKEAYRHVGEVKAAFLKELENGWERPLKWTLNGEPPSSGRFSHYILNVGFPGLSGESIVHHLEARGVYVSTQSACSSRKPGPSHVLKAMGLDRETIEGSIRISFSRFTSVSDAVAAAKHLKEVVRELSELGGHRVFSARSRR
ncbi:MAG TPA: cysteine desulfurase [Clostridia bacterium]|nr:cysteine desulfurase [Clostridia bacterium]